MLPTYFCFRAYRTHGRACCSLDPVATDSTAKFLMLPLRSGERKKKFLLLPCPRGGGKGQLPHIQHFVFFGPQGTLFSYCVLFRINGKVFVFWCFSIFSPKFFLDGGFPPIGQRPGLVGRIQC